VTSKQSAAPQGQLDRQTQKSAANAQNDLSVPAGNVRRVLWIGVSYSAPVTQDVTVSLDSGAGADYDHVLATISLSNAQHGVYVPSGGLFLQSDDALKVSAPAGGAGVTSAISVYSLIL
jgi:hypothetical protein